MTFTQNFLMAGFLAIGLCSSPALSVIETNEIMGKSPVIHIYEDAEKIRYLQLTTYGSHCATYDKKNNTYAGAAITEQGAAPLSCYEAEKLFKALEFLYIHQPVGASMLSDYLH